MPAYDRVGHFTVLGFWRGWAEICPSTHKTNRILYYFLIVLDAHSADGVGPIEYA